MDEVTTDLDLIARQALLVFLREESEVRGVTVIYSTHIFDGVNDWPTHLLHLKKGGVHFNGPIADAPATAPTAPRARLARSSGGCVAGSSRSAPSGGRPRPRRPRSRWRRRLWRST